MRHRLHPLGNRPAPKGGGQAQNSLQDGEVVRVLQHVANEALIDLEDLRRQALEIGERRITGTKVIERKTDAERRGSLDNRGDQRNVFERATLQHFQFKIATRHVWVRCQHGP